MYGILHEFDNYYENLHENAKVGTLCRFLYFFTAQICDLIDTLSRKTTLNYKQ